VQVYGCFYPVTVQRTIFNSLRWLLVSNADGTCDVPKDVGNLLTSDVCISAYVSSVIYIYILISRQCTLRTILK
jgi:hypothetical protein